MPASIISEPSNDIAPAPPGSFLARMRETAAPRPVVIVAPRLAPRAETEPKHTSGPDVGPAPAVAAPTLSMVAPSPAWPAGLAARLNGAGASVAELAKHYDRKTTEVEPELARLELAGLAHHGSGRPNVRLWFQGPKPIKQPEEPRPGPEIEFYRGDVAVEDDGTLWAQSRHDPEAPPQAIVLLSADPKNPDEERARDWMRQTVKHLNRRGFYTSQAHELIELADDTSRKDAAGREIRDPKRTIPVQPGFLEKRMSNGLLRFFDLDLRSRAPGMIDCPLREEYVDRPGRLEGWAADIVKRGQYPELPMLRGIVGFRFYGECGNLVSAHGYDEVSQIFYAPREEEAPIPRVAAGPNAVRQARKLADEVLDLFSDFPFETDADRSAYFALIVTAVVRAALSTAPLIGVDATTPGTGKTIIVRSAAQIATGAEPDVCPWKRSADEQEKTLNSIMLTSSPFVLLDNVDSPIGGALFDAILTSPAVTVRRLGGQVVPDVSTRKTFTATGNGLTPNGDTHRRMLMIRLVPHVESPEERSGFKIPRLLEYVRQNARELNAKVIAVIEAFREAGRPDETTIRKLAPFGGFEDWTAHVRNLCLWIGYADPCETRRRVRVKDDHHTFRTALYRALAKACESPDFKGLPVGQIATIRELSGVVPEDYFDFGGKLGVRFGKELAKLIGRIVNVDGVAYALQMRQVMHRSHYFVVRETDETRNRKG